MAFLPVFLYTGPEIGERNDTIEKQKVAVQKKYGQVDYYKVYATDTGIADVVNLLQNGSLFASARFVVLHNAELIKKTEDIDLLKKCINSLKSQETDDAWLIFVSEDNSVDKKLENLVPKENKKIFWEMFEDRKTQWIQSFFGKMNLRIQPDAVDLILDLIENNTESLRNECSRFSLCFEKGYSVTSEDVEKVLAHNREESAYTLFDSICDVEKNPSQRLALSLEILDKIRQTKDGSSVSIIVRLSYCFRRLLAWHKLFEEGNPSDFDLKIKGFSSKKAQNLYRGAARIWNNRETVAILALLSQGDMAIRTTGTSIENITLQTILYSIIIKNGRPLDSALYSDLQSNRI